MASIAFLVPSLQAAPFVVMAFAVLVYAWHRASLLRQSLMEVGLGDREEFASIQTTRPGIVARIAAQPRPVWLLTHMVVALHRMPSPDLRFAVEAAFSSYHTAVGHLRSLPSLCMLLGLIGTVVGLSMAVGAMGPQVIKAANSSDVGVLATTIAGQVTEFKTAFTSTLWSLIFAVITFLLGQRAAREVHACTTAARAYVLAEVVPHVVPPSLQVSLDKVRETLNEIGEATMRTTQDMAAAARPLADQVRSLTTATDASTKNFETASRTLMSSATSMQRNLLQLSDLQTEIRTQLQGVQDTFRQELEKVVRAQGTALTGFTKRADEVANRLFDTQHALSTGSSAIIVRLTEVSDLFIGATRQFKEAADRFDAMSREVGRQAYEGLEARGWQIAEALGETRKAVTDVSRDLNYVVQQLGELMGRLNPQLLPSEEWQRLRGALESVVAVGELFSEEESRLRDTLASQVGGFDAATQALSAVPQSLAAGLRSFSHSTDGAAAHLALAAQRMHETSTALMLGPAQFAATMQSAAASIEGATVALTERLASGLTPTGAEGEPAAAVPDMNAAPEQSGHADGVAPQ